MNTARTSALLLTATLAGCAMPGMFAQGTPIEVREVGRSLYCNTPSESSQALLLRDPQAVLDWQAGRGITLADGEALTQTAYAVVEMGGRPTGGYGVAVARTATLRDEDVTLSATFVSPAPGSIRTQALSSPCVLVQLPRGRYARVEVVDQSGEVRARSDAPPVPAAVPAAAETAPDEPPAPPADPGVPAT
jgi:hypothetical protein